MNFIKYILLAWSLTSLSHLLIAQEKNLKPVYDGQIEARLPANFRTTQKIPISIDETGFYEGLNRISASGSGQFSDTSLHGLMEEIVNMPIVIVDLRQESHGWINGKAVSWTDGQHNWANINKSREEIEKEEECLLHNALEKGVIVMHVAADSQEITVQRVQTEREVIESLGLMYVRIPVQDHCRPSDDAIEQFVTLIKSLPKSVWLHLHCRAGKGRTTTFLVFYDIMLNAKSVSLEDILKRHKLIGGADLTKPIEPTNYKYHLARERLELIGQFYRYCLDVPDFNISWKTWLQTQHAFEKTDN
jgi:protein tyrosine phosphatase (PTP) superfamily phosphohydrolase (DUF442 family)